MVVVGFAVAFVDPATGRNDSAAEGFTAGFPAIFIVSTATAAGFLVGFSAGLGSGFAADLGTGLAAGFAVGFGLDFDAGFAADLGAGFAVGFRARDSLTGFAFTASPESKPTASAPQTQISPAIVERLENLTRRTTPCRSGPF